MAASVRSGDQALFHRAPLLVVEVDPHASMVMDVGGWRGLDMTLSGPLWDIIENSKKPLQISAPPGLAHASPM